MKLAALAIAGCPIFPASSPWNQRVDDRPVHPRSDAMVQTIGATDTVHPDFGSGTHEGRPIGIPFQVVAQAQKRSRVTFEYASESDKGPYPIPAKPKIEGGGDRHLLLVQRGRCRLFELFAAERRGSAWHAGSGAIFDLRSNRLRPKGWTSADAAGLPILPGLVRQDEVARGEIKHALRFTVARTRNAFVFPARHFASDLDRPGPAGHGPALPPEGEREDRRPAAPGARDRHRTEALRDARRRQRLELVHQRRARPGLGQRRAARAQAPAGR